MHRRGAVTNGWWLAAALVVWPGGLPGQARGAPPGFTIPATRHAPVTTRPAGSTRATRAGGRVVAATFWSQSLGVRKRLVAWLPPGYDDSPARRYPVAIYLHGLWGRETDWTALGALDRAMDALVADGMPPFIVVMPDGDDGWYTTWNSLGDYVGCQRAFAPREGDTVDTYCVPWLHYDDYVARDLVAFVDSTWRTEPRRAHRAIAGLSMGGYGAISLALQYPDVFSVAVSHSGVLSPLYDGAHPFEPPPRYATTPERLQASWGEKFWPLIAPAFGPDTAAWWSRDPARRAARLWKANRRAMPALMLDIGTDDGLLDQNRAFRWELQRLGVPHAYAEWPGKHDWPYWSLHVRESLRFIAARIAAGQ